ncbi:STM3941 family protein [Rhizobium binxianense]
MKIYRSPAKMIGLAVLSLLMTALSVFIGYNGYVKEGSGGLAFFIGIAGFILFFASLVALVVKLFDRRPAIDLSEEGLLVADLARERIRWEDLLGLRIFRLQTQKFIELQITPQAAAKLTISRMARLNNKALGKSNEYLTMSMSGLTMTGEAIYELIAKRGQP